MKVRNSLAAITFFTSILLSWQLMDDNWIVKNQKGYTLHYTTADKKNLKEYNKLIKTGISSVRSFFQSGYPKSFSIFVHPGRSSLDSAWQKDWNMPSFRSECWMVASGVAAKLDMISPKTWDKEACEHRYSERTKTQQLITHELVHVFHGQSNISPDFSDVEGMDWFVEGLATYASGQLDSVRIKEIKKAIAGNKVPDKLDNFWTGALKYGLSGSVVMYIDHRYGRATLKALLPIGKKQALLAALQTTEMALLNEWKTYIGAL